MSIIRKINKQLAAEKAEVFNLREWWPSVIEFFKNICFLGEVDKDNAYISMLHQARHTETGAIKNINMDEANQFCLNGQFITLQNHDPFAWTFWRINLKTRFITVYTSFNGNPNRSPKDNFIIAQEQKRLYPGQKLHYNAHFKHLTLSDRRIFRELVLILNQARNKNNDITIGNFNMKVFVNFMEYFGIVNNKNFVKDKFIDTKPPEVIRLPQRYDSVRIDKDTEVMNRLRGTVFETLNFENNSTIRRFKKFKDMHDYLYSLIDFINKHALELELAQRISFVRKHYESMQWPIPQNTEEADKNRNLLTRYEIAITKFENRIAFRADVQEYGICYYITNYIHGPNPWDGN